jgi:hypothetical protein
MLKTLEKEQAREFVRQYVTEHLEPLLMMMRPPSHQPLAHQRPEEPNTTTIKLDSNVVSIESHGPENE